MKAEKVLGALVILMSFILPCHAGNVDVFELARKGTPEELKAALRNGADFNVSRSIADGETELFVDGETPLHIAAMYNTNAGSIKFLLSQGIEADAEAGNERTEYGTPLSCAVAGKNIVAVRELLKAGADPDDWTFRGYYFGSAFHDVAARYREKSSAREVIAALIEAGGDIDNHEEADDMSREIIASELKAEGAKSVFLHRRKWTSSDPFSPENMTISLQSVSFFAMTCTPLVYAVIYDNPVAVNILLDFEADTDIRSIEGKRALDYAQELPENSRLRKSPAYARLIMLSGN